MAGCGSSGGTSTPPAPPPPVTPPPPPPPPEPTFEERLADLAEFDPNPCRARTPGFEALGGWLLNDGRELGTSRVWIRDVGSRTAPPSESHGARVWATFTDCAARSDPDRYFTDGPTYIEARTSDGQDAIQSSSFAPPWQDIPFPEPSILPDIYDGERDGQRILLVQGLGNENGRGNGHLEGRAFQAALLETDKALWVLIGGYVGEGEDRAPAKDVNSSDGVIGSSLCGDAAPLCLFGPWNGTGAIGTSYAAPQTAAALDTVWAVWPDMDILDLRNLAFDCAEDMPAPEGETATTRSYSYKNGRTFHVRHQLHLGPRHPQHDLPVHTQRRPAGSDHRQRDLRWNLRARGRDRSPALRLRAWTTPVEILVTGLHIRSLARTSLWPPQRI